MDKTLTTIAAGLFSKLEYTWRILITGCGFLIFGIGSIFLSMTIFPLMALSIRDKQKCYQLTQKIIQKSFQLFLDTLSLFNVLSYCFKDMENLRKDHGTIIVANHPSLLDFIFIASCMPRCDCIVKKALFNNIFLKGIVKAAGYIPNNNAETLLNSCQEKLKKSGTLLIFPEGTRSKAGVPITLQRGVANIALRTKSDIRLVTVYCTYPILSKEQKWYHIPPKKPKFVITTHQKLHIHDFISDNNRTATDARNLTDYLQKQLNNHIEQIKQMEKS